MTTQINRPSNKNKAVYSTFSGGAMPDAAPAFDAVSVASSTRPMTGGQNIIRVDANQNVRKVQSSAFVNNGPASNRSRANQLQAAQQNFTS